MIDRLRISVLVDNEAAVKGDFGLGGFSALIECAYPDGSSRKILFDTGYADFLERNSGLLGVDLEGIDFIFLSHGHFDHTGGLDYALSRTGPDTKVVSHPDILLPKTEIKDSGERRNVGLAMTETVRKAMESGRFIFAKNWHSIAESAWSSGEIPRKTSFENLRGAHLRTYKGNADQRIVDPIIDDAALVLELSRGRAALLCGCCHAGIVNATRHITDRKGGGISHILGGLQLHNAADDELDSTCEGLRGLGLERIYPMHSSGKRGFDFLKSRLGDSVESAGVGSVIEIA